MEEQVKTFFKIFKNSLEFKKLFVDDQVEEAKEFVLLEINDFYDRNACKFYIRLNKNKDELEKMFKGLKGCWFHDCIKFPDLTKPIQSSKLVKGLEVMDGLLNFTGGVDNQISEDHDDFAFDIFYKGKIADFIVS
jgi:hypothetical protein